jgi:hypothetical protein
MSATTTFNSPEHDYIAYRWGGSGFGGRPSAEAGDRKPPTEGIARHRSLRGGRRSPELPSER